MDPVILLQRARDAGLRLEVADTSLKISGPRKAEPLVRLLAEHKAQVLDALRKVQEVPESPRDGTSTERDPGPYASARAHKPQVFDALRKVQEVQKVQGTESRGTSTERDLGPYASALAAFRAKCPAYVPEDRWHEAIADATAFVSEWGAQAQAFGWTSRELFGLHPVPEQPAANYSRLSRLDDMGLIWLLRGRPVILLTATEAVMRCHSGATLTYRRQNEPAAGPAGDSIDDIWGAKDGALADGAAA
jgi:hypothetical protein